MDQHFFGKVNNSESGLNQKELFDRFQVCDQAKPLVLCSHFGNGYLVFHTLFKGARVVKVFSIYLYIFKKH